MINLHKDAVLDKLKKFGVKIKYKHGTRQPIALSADSRNDLGIKVLGYVDYIGLPLQKKQKQQRKRSYLNEYKKEVKPLYNNKLHIIRWFNTKEEANECLNNLKEKYVGKNAKSYITITEQNEYRLIFECTIDKPIIWRTL